jgi:membrane protein DedA with SNARE-associated domain
VAGLFVRGGARIGVSADRLARLEDLVRHWGGAALVGGRFVGLVRALAPFLAGAVGLPGRRVLAHSVLGAGLWGSALIATAYVFAAFDNHIDAAGNLAVGALGAGVLTWTLLRGGGLAPQH